MNSPKETFVIARCSGDGLFLRWIYERLLYVHGEDPCMDYMHTMKEFADSFHERFEPKRQNKGRSVMKLVRAFRAAGAAFALVLIGAVAHAVLPTPVAGPSLGDQNTNVFTIQQALTFMNQVGAGGITAPSANSQANCTAITNPMNTITSSVSTGSVCLPAATAGRIVWINNTTANGINVFGSNTPAVVGTQDTINTTTGSTANTAILPAASGGTKTAVCYAYALGAWTCSVNA